MNEKTFELIENIKKCSFKEGDIIFITTKNSLPSGVCKKIQKYLGDIIRPRVRVVVTPFNLEVSVLTIGEE